ncbi:hypothetical protein B0H14DRAFT_2584767 [Mycena olivaceomarginata]|nr:hypothetical protein B0H14DRAFT_2648781 [Mycena olivaceomarginata]KAJ7808912.1 hypothetical protein B0H14DRAFT_2608560 [Mycena olivaceomarginata]KAJ7814036.1 hypothetical protein B0H14DRAFT_2604477 [Mycena olivaceomarginata]KAJ7845452.1 hypothetical protein B0H14DRAFT_2584767 [Mycena olivaceomarginata]
MSLPVLSLPSGPLTFCSEFYPLLKRVTLHGLASNEDLQAVVEAAIKCTSIKTKFWARAGSLFNNTAARNRQINSGLNLRLEASQRPSRAPSRRRQDLSTYDLARLRRLDGNDHDRDGGASYLENGIGAGDAARMWRYRDQSPRGIGAVLFNFSPSHALRNVGLGSPPYGFTILAVVDEPQGSDVFVCSRILVALPGSHLNFARFKLMFLPTCRLELSAVFYLPHSRYNWSATQIPTRGFYLIFHAPEGRPMHLGRSDYLNLAVTNLFNFRTPMARLLAPTSRRPNASASP